MCGIVYYQSNKNKPVARKVEKRYRLQRNRGTQGFGVFLPLKNQMAHNPKESKALKHLRKQRDSAILFHHRMPTSTDNTKNTCHPFSTKNYFKDKQYILVHNGVISNAYALREKHMKELGIKYVSACEKKYSNGSAWTQYNDTESLLWSLALYLHGDQENLDAAGSIAFIAFEQNHDGTDQKMYFGRNAGSPLYMKFSKNIISIASVSNDKSDQEVEMHQLYCFDFKTSKLTKTALNIPSSVVYKQPEFKGYAHEKAETTVNTRVQIGQKSLLVPEVGKPYSDNNEISKAYYERKQKKFDKEVEECYEKLVEAADGDVDLAYSNLVNIALQELEKPQPDAHQTALYDAVAEEMEITLSCLEQEEKENTEVDELTEQERENTLNEEPHYETLERLGFHHGTN